MTTLGVIDLGDVVTLGVTVHDSAGVLADGGTVTVTVTLPDGSTATPTITHVSTGTYSASYTPATAGRYGVRWVATGANASAYADSFTVSAPALLISLAEAKAFLNITATTNDDELRGMIEAATAAAEEWTGRVLANTTITETFDGGVAKLFLRQPAALSITTVVDNGTTLAASAYRLTKGGESVERVSGSQPYYWTYRVDGISVTYWAGVSGRRLSIANHAVKQMLLHLWQTQRGPRRAQYNAEDSWNSSMGYSYPSRVVQLLQPLQIPGF